MNTRKWIAMGLAAIATATTATIATTTAATAATAPTQHAYRQQDLQRDLDAITATGVPGVLAEVRTGGRQLRGTSGVLTWTAASRLTPTGSSGSAATPRRSTPS